MQVCSSAPLVQSPAPADRQDGGFPLPAMSTFRCLCGLAIYCSGKLQFQCQIWGYPNHTTGQVHRCFFGTTEAEEGNVSISIKYFVCLTLTICLLYPVFCFLSMVLLFVPYYIGYKLIFQCISHLNMILLLLCVPISIYLSAVCTSSCILVSA